MFYGDQGTGAFQMYPGQLGIGPKFRNDSGCNTGEGQYFDPRKRDWYVVAATGPKDIILVLDRSSITSARLSVLSSSGDTRLRAIQDAAKGVLSLTSRNDFVSVIAFGDDATVLSSRETTERATNETISGLKERIDSLTAEGRSCSGNTWMLPLW